MVRPIYVTKQPIELILSRVSQSFFGLNFGQNADIDIILDNQDERKMGEIKDENGRKERFPLFYDGESVTGKVSYRKKYICSPTEMWLMISSRSTLPFTEKPID